MVTVTFMVIVVVIIALVMIIVVVFIVFDVRSEGVFGSMGDGSGIATRIVVPVKFTAQLVFTGMDCGKGKLKFQL